MATLDLDENHAQYQIQAYRPGLIRINGKSITSSVIISPDNLIEDWEPQSIEQLCTASFSIIIDLKPDILLIGTGSSLVFLSVETYGHLINQGIGVEVMNTSAACRTFNALAAENRRVAAALIIK
jgi:uncharacterized protein